MKKKLFVMAALLLITGVMALYIVYERINRYADSPLLIEKEYIFTLSAGTGRTGLEQQIVEQKIVGKSRWFSLLLSVEPTLNKFKAGTYRLTPDMTIRQFLLLLSSGKEAQFSIRFIEGTRLKEWLLVLKQSPYLKHDLQNDSAEQVSTKLVSGYPQNAEGWFYPDTYLYTAGVSDKVILQRAHQRMQSALDKAWVGRDKSLPYKTAYELLIMASIIEKETGINDERNKVSSVFVNRLKQGIRLQTDPTVIYGMGELYNGNITRRDLETNTAYNTYTIDGLPPTPIAMPTEASLEAAAHPAQTDYLYFVANGKGGHIFSRDLQGHNQAVRDYLKTLRQNNAR